MGYRRTGSNIFNTRSNKKMTSLVSKTMAFGMLAPFAALDGMSSSNHSSYIPGEPKHYNPKKHKNGIVICGVLLLLCPIAAFITFYCFDWLMFLSVLVFGIVEVIVSVIAVILKDDKYIYRDEVDVVSKGYNKNENIIITLFIGMIILNWYPFILLFTWVWDSEFGGVEEILVLGIIGFKSLLIGAGAIPQLFQNKKDVKENIERIFYVYNRPNRVESKSETKSALIKNDKKQKNDNQRVDYCESNFPIPKINGEYTEEFMDNYGTLRIGSTHAQIEFYFPGPDARYKGTFISIQENEIDKYINAYRDNWRTAEELQVKVSDTPEAKFNQLGELGMNITVTQNSIMLCIDNYHLPICSQKECDNIINHFNIAKYRIKEIRQRLFE